MKFKKGDRVKLSTHAPENAKNAFRGKRGVRVRTIYSVLTGRYPYAFLDMAFTFGARELDRVGSHK